MSEDKEGQTLGALLNLGATRDAVSPSLDPASGEQTLESVQARVAALLQRMEELRAQTEAEVLKAWASPWKGEEMVRGKVDARLASNTEFRIVMTQCREAQALEAKLNPKQAQDAGSGAGSSHPAIGR